MNKLISICALATISCTSGCYKRHEAARTTNLAPSHTHTSERAAAKSAPDAQAAQLAEIPAPPTTPQPIPTGAGLKVALFGDQGVRATSRAELQLIARERADMVIHLGDLSYDEASPLVWEAQVDSVLGPDFSYFAVIGNHDIPSWFIEGGFAQRLGARL